MQLIYYCVFFHARGQKINNKKKELQPMRNGRGLN